MTTYYVSPFGLDANNGLGPDPGHATNKPWLTIGKGLSAAVSSGDTVKICPGTYRETVSVTMTSAVVETFVQGDVQNTSGFKDGSGVLVAGGEIIWTAYTTNDKTAPTAAATLDLNGRDFLTFENITFVGGNVTAGSAVNANTTNSVNIKFVGCYFISGSTSDGAAVIEYTGLANVASNWEIDRCVIRGPMGSNVRGIGITLPTSASADYDSNFVVKNTLILGQRGIRAGSSGADAFKGGGIDIFNCTLICGGLGFFLSGTGFSTSIPCTIYNSIVLSSTCLSVGASGQLTENYNLLYGTTTRTNVTAGANSQASTSSMQYAMLAHAGQEMVIGSQLRPFMSPMAGSPLLGFGNQAGSPVVDAWNRIRPAGGSHGSPGIGYLERHDSWIKETVTTDAGSVAISITGPGDHDFKIPVDAASTTISIKMRRDTTYGEATGLPQAILLANGEIGYAGETKTMVAADDTWETLTFAAFTPSQKGVVTLRVVSRDTTATGKTFADTLTVV